MIEWNTSEVQVKSSKYSQKTTYLQLSHILGPWPHTTGPKQPVTADRAADETEISNREEKSDEIK